MFIENKLKLGDSVASVVLYNPDIERLKQNLLSLSSQVEKIYIVDNASNNISEVCELVKALKINSFIVKNKENCGIAKALNQAFELAYQDGYDWLITMDQDSIMPSGGIEMLMQNCKDNVGIICPQINDINVQQTNKIEKKTEIIQKCITSGSLTKISAWKAIGGFDEKMFIDGVDFDFCKRIRDFGMVIIRDHRVVLVHEIGHATVHKLLFWKIKTKNHSAFRKYYIARNIIYYDRKTKYKGYPIVSVMRITKQLILVLLFEDNKRDKTKKIISGMIDGFKLAISE